MKDNKITIAILGIITGTFLLLSAFMLDVMNEYKREIGMMRNTIEYAQEVVRQVEEKYDLGPQLERYEKEKVIGKEI